MQGRHFIKAFILIVGGGLGVVFLINFIVDPFGVERTFSIKGFNRYKNAFSQNTRVTKLPLSADINPRILFLGTSRTEYLAPGRSFPAEERARAFNFALSGGQPHEMRDLLQWAADRYPVERVYYGIDFINLTDRTPLYRKGWDKKLVEGREPLWAGEAKFFLTWTALKESYSCVQNNRRYPEGSNTKYQYDRHGSRTQRWREMKLNKRGDEWLQKQFARIHDQYKAHYNKAGLSLHPKKLDAYADIVRFCRRKGITFKAFVSPIHVSQFRTLLRSSSFPVYKRYLRFLGEHGGFYYFSGDTPLTRDSSNFWDTQHPRNKVSKWLVPHLRGPKKASDRFVAPGSLDSLIHGLKRYKREER